MNDVVETGGMVLFAAPSGEYDKRLVLLTADLGKVTVFAHGARRQTNAWQAATQPFASGTFRLFPGKSAYTLRGAVIREYFTALRGNLEAAAYASYFAELASFYTRENMDARNVLNLLYLAVEALLKEGADPKAVRLLYELRMFAEAGEFPDTAVCAYCGHELTDGAWWTPGRDEFTCPDCRGAGLGSTFVHRDNLEVLRAAVNGKLSRVFSLPVTEGVREELSLPAARMRRRFADKDFRSLPVLDALTGDFAP